MDYREVERQKEIFKYLLNNDINIIELLPRNASKDISESLNIGEQTVRIILRGDRFNQKHGEAVLKAAFKYGNDKFNQLAHVEDFFNKSAKKSSKKNVA